MKTSTGFKRIILLCALSIFILHSISAQLINDNNSKYLRKASSTHTIKVEPGWNLLSIPLSVSDGAKSTLFPTATSDAFIYDDSYIQKDTLHNVEGFWLKFETSQDCIISGDLIFDDTVEIHAGWNMIGSITVPIAINTIIKDPPDMILSDYFSYFSEIGYKQSDTILPGFGYWVKASKDGKLIFTSDSVKSITITDETILPEVDSNLVSVSTDSTLLTLTYSSADVVPQFLPGDVIVGMSGDGYLRKVVSVEYQDNVAILTTTDASFDEAFITGIVDTTFDLMPSGNLIFSKISFNDEIMTKSGKKYITVNSEQPNIVNIFNTNSFQIRFPNFNLRIGVPINEAGPYLSVHIDTVILTLSFKPQVYLNFRTGNFRLLVQQGLKTELKNVNAIVSGELNLESDELKLIPTIPLGMYPVFPPIVFVASLDVVALIEADFTVDGNINLGSYFMSEFNTTIGAEIKDGAWTIYKTASYAGDADLSIEPEGISFSGEARFVLLKPKLNFKINGLIGPNLFVKGFEYNKLEFPPLVVELGFGVSAGGEFNFKILRKTIADFSIDFFDYRWPFLKDTLDNLAPSQPSNPNPPDQATNQPTNLTLSWLCTDPEDDPLVYDVYFGTDNPPLTKVSSDQTTTSIERTGLSQSTTYFWKVVAKDDHSNSTSGPVWRFTTTTGGGSSCVGVPTVTYEGKVYNTVQIGSQCWLRENLDVGVRINGSQDANNNGTIEKYCYNDDPANCNTYGGLYQWNEAMQYTTTPGARGICPSGWHIPTRVEFQTLSDAVGGDGNALKAIGQGTGGGAGTNTSGFSALLAGGRYSAGYFLSLSHLAHFWSSSEGYSAGACGMLLGYIGSGIHLDGYYRGLRV